ncbi:MAG: glycerophosphodiester phosphodiesterase family protein [Clostridia bacterium]|nr:glycerophosphodiester phosphodiesterase family protein [Clostridia bacterium]
MNQYKLIAHRGLYHNEKGIYENSMKAFYEAIAKQYAIELDVQILKDGTIVVFHDENLERMTGVNKRVRDCTLAEIKTCHLLNSNEKIPTLREVLELVAGKVAIVIEIKRRYKSYGIEKAVYEILKEYNGEYCIESFNPFTVLWFKNHHKEIARGLLSTKELTTLKKIIVATTNNLPFLYPLLQLDFISYRYTDINESIKNRCQKNHVYLIAWTIKNKKEYIKIKEKCDGIIFENFLP